MGLSKINEAYDLKLITMVKAIPEEESKRIVNLFLTAIKGADDGITAEIEEVDSFCRCIVNNKFGVHYSSYFEKHILLYLILTYSPLLADPKKWSIILKNHSLLHIAKGQVAVIFNTMDSFYALMEISKMKATKIIKFPGRK